MNSGDICHCVLEPQTFSWLNGSSYGDGRPSRRFGQQFATAPICSGTRLGQGWEIGPRCRRPEIARKCGAAVGQERPSGKPGGLFLLSSLRANGSRECAPDDRLRDAIQSSTERMDFFVASLRVRALSALSVLLPSSSAKADDPVRRALSILSLAPTITGCPPSRARHR